MMVFAIDSEVRGYHVYKDVRRTGIDFELQCSPKSAIAKTGLPLYTRTLQYNENSHVTSLIFAVWELIFVERQLLGIY